MIVSFWVIGIALIIVFVVIIIRGKPGQAEPGQAEPGQVEPGWSEKENSNNPLDSLKTRFAKGEIDREEFEERKAEIEDVS